MPRRKSDMNKQRGSKGGSSRRGRKKSQNQEQNNQNTTQTGDIGEMNREDSWL